MTSIYYTYDILEGSRSFSGRCNVLGAYSTSHMILRSALSVQGGSKSSSGGEADFCQRFRFRMPHLLAIRRIATGAKIDGRVAVRILTKSREDK